MCIALVCKRLPKLQIKFRISHSFRLRNPANLVSKSVFRLAERNTPTYLALSSNYGLGCPDLGEKKDSAIAFQRVKKFYHCKIFVTDRKDPEDHESYGRIGKFRIPQWPWDEHDCKANAGQLLYKNKNKHRQFAAESLENDRNLTKSKISKLKLYQ